MIYSGKALEDHFLQLHSTHLKGWLVITDIETQNLESHPSLTKERALKLKATESWDTQVT